MSVPFTEHWTSVNPPSALNATVRLSLGSWYLRYLNTSYCLFSECDTPVELGFLVDRSGSITTQNFEKVKSFVLNVIAGFDVSREGTHVGIITYSSDAKTILSFEQFDDPNFDYEKLNDTIRDALSTPEGGKTRIDLALKKADQDLFSDTTKYRSFVPKVRMTV